jgi:hypothetical protein
MLRPLKQTIIFLIIILLAKLVSNLIRLSLLCFIYSFRFSSFLIYDRVVQILMVETPLIIWQLCWTFAVILLTAVIMKRGHNGSSPSAPPQTTTSTSVTSSTATSAAAPTKSSSSVSPRLKMLLPLLNNSKGIALDDRIICEGHPLYESSRSLWNGMINKRPLAFVRVHGAIDVIHVLQYATERKIKISVKGGGHNIAGTALVDAGVVIDMHHMRGIHVDVEHQLVRVQGGATW